MRVCINPDCNGDRQNPDTAEFCLQCKCELIIDGTYTVKKLLSDKSGFGTIYEVEDLHQQPKVLKILSHEFNNQPKIVSLFQQEAFLLGKIDSAGLPKIAAYIHHNLPNKKMLHGIVMEKIEGINLYEWIRSHNPLTEKMAIAWMRQITKILKVVHQNGYFHRDIKPSNIMIRPSGQLVLIDFGTAREASYTYLAKVGSVGGITQITSAGYTSPEQERGFAVPQSDFYALGMTFLHLVTGKYPLDMHDSHTNTYTWRDFAPKISEDFAKFLEQLIAPRPVDRPSDCEMILHTLDEIDRLQKERQTKRQQEAQQKINQQEQQLNFNKVWLGIAFILVGLTTYAIAIFYRILPSPIPLATPTVQTK
ncbi:serine/threonine protein kinase [Pseudanabaena sp. FACHB-1998]|uniref:serine/threonine protein kinase n=1 Tax=Pseudanabaena sp. FACHB-1998 TaxID=2692858 RepID=UPI00168198C1|nr:serine/threonine-protein kinase [Pseudanabaena sp. FACHB-1998]MBD2177453.1 serine/threonine protein kinase [Pseudanabaena sp. FACHB-1998]